jgi:small redox-active disulfide protein 2
MKDDISQITVAGQRTGIVGLHETLDAVSEAEKGWTDAEITAELMNRLSKRNYIPPKVKEAYETAFLREYKKRAGLPVEEDMSGPVQVKVLGPGCPNCERLEQDIMQVMAEAKLPADLDHVRDPVAISAYGLLTVPALVVDGAVVASGRVPAKEEIQSWLQEAVDKQNNP